MPLEERQRALPLLLTISDTTHELSVSERSSSPIKGCSNSSSSARKARGFPSH